MRIEEQKEHQKKVDAIAGPPSTLPEPDHPHLSRASGEAAESYTGEADHASVHDGSVPIAESGTLRMMPPSTGLPVQSGTYGTSPVAQETEAPAAYGSVQLEQQAGPEQVAGMSSDEPVHDALSLEPHVEQAHA